MVNANMRTYNYYTYSNENEYGQQLLPDTPTGTVKASINLTSQSIQDNILYQNATYLALTHDTLTDENVLEYGDKKLKVLYVNPYGRFNQVFLEEI